MKSTIHLLKLPSFFTSIINVNKNDVTIISQHHYPFKSIECFQTLEKQNSKPCLYAFSNEWYMNI